MAHHRNDRGDGRSDTMNPDGDVLRVGLCQVFTEPWAVEDNLGRTLEAIDMAARQGAEVAVTPECVLHGYAELKTPADRERLQQIAEPIDGPCLQRLRGQAKESHLYVLVGFAEQGTAGRVHNSAALISPAGEVLFVYRKVHCRPFESVYHEGLFTPGDTFYTSTLHLGSRQFVVGAMICFDREVVESVRCLRSLGVEIVFCPLATPTFDLYKPGERADNEMVTRCRAAENEVFIVVVNHAGRFNGGSFVVGPHGEPLCQMGSEPGVRVVDVPVGIVARAYHSNPLGWMGWGYRRPEVYRKYLS